MGSETKHVCCSTDDNYAQHCGVMLCSLFENNSDAQFEVHILISSLLEENIKNLRSVVERYGKTCHFHEVDAKRLKGVKFRENRPLTEAAYYRILMASIFDSSISTVLYLDADLVVVGDITPLFKLNIDDFALAAPKDLAKLNDERRIQLSIQHNEPYFCSGMMLINLDYWRKNKSEEKLIEFSKRERKVYNHDQDALNAVFHGHWFMLSPKWNRFYPDIYDNSFFEHKSDKIEFDKNPVIIHFSNYFKPWNKINWIGLKWNKYRKYYYEYLDLTPWTGAKSQKLKINKPGMYIFLIMMSYKSIFIYMGHLIEKMLLIFRKIIFLPLVVFYKLRSF